MVATVLAVFGLLVGVVVLVAAAAGSLSGDGTLSSGTAAGAGTLSSGAALPPGWAQLYSTAAATCPGLSWSTLAAIGTVETNSGQSTASGVWSGANSAGAEGPMQFEPATFAAYATVGPGGVTPASPYDPVDAVYTAAHLLCANGAGSAATLRSAIFGYNHATAYVNTVLVLALAFGDTPSITGTVVSALSFAARALGTPYVWGGTGNGGFDCSGLVQAAYRAGGVALPRVAQDQFDRGPVVGGADTLVPGDLVFFGIGTGAVDHVGLYVGAGEMIDAPHTGALVRVESAHWSDLVGVTRPD
jgi:cell wall-associated NlpC family hydrolase